MKKLFLAISSLLFIALLCEHTIKIRPNENIITTMYNVASIVFSVGLGLIVSFSLDGVKNPKYIKKIRNNIKNLRASFIMTFIATTLFIVCYKSVPKISYYSIWLDSYALWFMFSFLMYAIGFFIYNFIQLQTLKDDIFDRVNKENNNEF